MVSLPGLAKLKITELNKDNIDSVIKVLKDTPEEYFDDISKKEYINMYKLAKKLIWDLEYSYFI